MSNFKKIIYVSLNLLGGILLFVFNKVDAQNIDSLIFKMTLAEKVGQMAQVDLGVLWEGETCNPKDGKVKLNEDKLRKAIAEYKIGSVLNCGCGTGTHSKDEWRQWIGEIQAVAQRSGVLPVLYGIDAIASVGCCSTAVMVEIVRNLRIGSVFM